MITQTSELAVKSMIYIALKGEGRPLPPKEIAAAMRCSAAYLAKVLGQLAKAGLLAAHRGAQGGVELAREPERIALLDIVQATQGVMIGNYCRAIGDAIGPVCGFHQAMLDVHLSTVRALGRWTLRDLAARPGPTGRLKGNIECRMHFLEACGPASGCQPKKRKGGPRPRSKAPRAD